MKIQVYSRSKNRAQVIDNLAHFFARVLGITSSRKTLTIYTVTDHRRTTGNMGSTVKPDDDNIAILLDSRLGDERMLVTLAHEMVHVAQLARGHLKPGAYGRRAGYWLWMGRRVADDCYNSPWERRAYMMEGLLVAQVKAAFASRA